jgi:hypothetical protein
MLSVWSLMHGTAMHLIRGGVAGPLRAQMIHSCLDAVEAIIAQAALSKRNGHSGPKWPAHLILGEAADSKVSNGENDASPRPVSTRRVNSKQKPAVRPRAGGSTKP